MNQPLGTLMITGAAGYIGSHTAEALLAAASSFGLKRLLFLDDLSSGHLETIQTLKALARNQIGSENSPELEFFSVSLLDPVGLKKIFAASTIDSVLHFAAKISVEESVANPDLYFKNNVQGSKNLLNAMKESGTKKIVFSSTAAVYGTVQDPNLAYHPLTEGTPLAPINPYGESKFQIEGELMNASEEWGLRAVIFRYFNAAGASLSGSLGEWHEPETHLIPLILRAAQSQTELQVYGNDYQTRDGSCIRDYIHVSDLADAHLKGLKRLNQNPDLKIEVYNLGTAKGTSVFEVLAAAEKVTGLKVNYRLRPRRAGDSAVLIADSTKAQKDLGWTPVNSDIEMILKTALAWETKLKNRPHP